MLSRICFHSKTTSAHIERCFHQRSVKSQQSPSIFRSKPKIHFKTTSFVKTKCFSSKTSLDTKIAVLRSMQEEFRQKSKKFTLKVQKFLGNYAFFVNHFVPQLVPVGTLNEATVSLQKILRKVRHSLPQIEKQFGFFFIYYFQMHAITWQVDCNFDKCLSRTVPFFCIFLNQSPEFFTEFFTKNLKKILNVLFFTGKCFPSKMSSERVH